jgi:hypothetical protein
MPIRSDEVFDVVRQTLADKRLEANFGFGFREQVAGEEAAPWMTPSGGTGRMHLYTIIPAPTRDEV